MCRSIEWVVIFFFKSQLVCQISEIRGRFYVLPEQCGQKRNFTQLLGWINNYLWTQFKVPFFVHQWLIFTTFWHCIITKVCSHYWESIGSQHKKYWKTVSRPTSGSLCPVYSNICIIFDIGIILSLELANLMMLCATCNNDHFCATATIDVLV